MLIVVDSHPIEKLFTEHNFMNHVYKYTHIHKATLKEKKKNDLLYHFEKINVKYNDNNK